MQVFNMCKFIREQPRNLYRRSIPRVDDAALGRKKQVVRFNFGFFND